MMAISCATTTRRRICCLKADRRNSQCCNGRAARRLRTAIVLREIEGMSYEEISKIMNCPIGTVRSRIFRAQPSRQSSLAHKRLFE